MLAVLACGATDSRSQPLNQHSCARDPLLAVSLQASLYHVLVCCLWCPPLAAPLLWCLPPMLLCADYATLIQNQPGTDDYEPPPKPKTPFRGQFAYYQRAFDAPRVHFIRNKQALDFIRYAVSHCTVLYCPVLYWIVLYWTVLYCTVPYCTVQTLASHDGCQVSGSG